MLGTAKDADDESTVFALMELTLHSGREIKAYNKVVMNIEYIGEVVLKLQSVWESSRGLVWKQFLAGVGTENLHF